MAGLINTRDKVLAFLKKNCQHEAGWHIIDPESGRPLSFDSTGGNRVWLKKIDPLGMFMEENTQICVFPKILGDPALLGPVRKRARSSNPVTEEHTPPTHTTHHPVLLVLAQPGDYEKLHPHCACCGAGKPTTT